MISKKYNIEKIFYFIFSLAIISRVISDLLLNRQGIHSGEVFPSRQYFPSIPIYSVFVFYLELTLAFVGALLLNSKKVRTASLIIVIAYLMGLSQMFQNQKTLILIVASTLLIQPLSKNDRSSIWFLRYQLILVYSISALQKMFSGFNSGLDLLETTKYLLGLENNLFIKQLLTYLQDPRTAEVFSLSTIVVELLIPIALIKAPRLGVALVILLHLSMNLLMKDITPFSLTMLALSLTFLMDFDLDK